MTAADARRKLRTRAFRIPGPAGVIEGQIDEPDDANDPARPVAVICHPHPLYQGTMQNKVVHTLARTYARRGLRAVRFNFRGVGQSEGTFDDGVGETADALAVVDWASTEAGVVHLAGFSFGGMVALRAASDQAPASLVTVAPAIRFFSGAFEPPDCRWLLLQGEADEVVDAADVIQWANTLSRGPVLRSFGEVGHYFHGSLGLVADAVNDFLDAPAGSETE